jgi:hypothetical protein
LFSLIAPDARGQVNDSTRWTGASYPDLGFSASWPDNWKITGAPDQTHPRLIVQKNFEANRPDEGAYCKVAVSQTPSTAGMSQATLDDHTASKRPSDQDVAAVLRQQGLADPHVYNTNRPNH